MAVKIVFLIKESMPQNGYEGLLEPLQNSMKNSWIQHFHGIGIGGKVSK